MKKAIMVVHDILGEKYVQPHITETVEIAIRDFMEAASDEKKETTLAKYPQDYDLLHCGYFDPQTDRDWETLSELKDSSKNL